MTVRRAVALLGSAVIGLSLVPAGMTASALPLAQSPALAKAAQTSQSAAAKTAAAKAAASSKRASVRVATFNVRSARIRGDKRSWNARATDVARTIVSRNPGVVALQELGPGRADGVKGKIGGHLRQTESMIRALRKVGGSKYKLTRVTAYNPPHSTHGTQGARILYDTTRYTLVSNCRETTGKSNWNRSCSMELPRAAGQGKGLQRSAAFALFKDKSSGKKFWVTSAHLDDHKGSSKYIALRQRQAAYVVNRVAAMNTRNYPVIFGGDINSWRNDKGNWAPHRTLAGKGFTDSSARAAKRVNLRYSTVNHFQKTQKKSGRSTGAHLDVLMVKGGKSFSSWENVTRRVDTSRPSDHNMVVATLTL